LLQGGRLLGVLDIDSPETARFDAQDSVGLNAAVTLLVQQSDFSKLVD
jgi:putative methionine-R-sulfoxide reductase with GAF domain